MIRSDVLAEQGPPGEPDGSSGARTADPTRDLTPITRARGYLRDSATFEERPAHELIALAFRGVGVADGSVHRGIMGFDHSSGVLSARPLRFHADLPVVVEAVGSRDGIEAALPKMREVLERGLITLTDVELYQPETRATNNVGGAKMEGGEHLS